MPSTGRIKRECGPTVSASVVSPARFVSTIESFERQGVWIDSKLSGDVQVRVLASYGKSFG